MKLLTADIVKSDADKRIDEQKSRMRKQNDEESNLTAKLNKTRLFTESEKKRMDDELTEYKKSIKLKRAELEKEVTALESRRSKALEPIKEIRKEANDRLLSAIKKESELDKREKKLKKDEKSIESERQSIADEKNAVEADLKNIANVLTKKQIDIDRQDNSLKRIEILLSLKEDNLNKREKDIDNKAQEVRAFSIKQNHPGLIQNEL